MCGVCAKLARKCAVLDMAVICSPRPCRKAGAQPACAPSRPMRPHAAHAAPSKQPCAHTRPRAAPCTPVRAHAAPCAHTRAGMRPAHAHTTPAHHLLHRAVARRVDDQHRRQRFGGAHVTPAVIAAAELHGDVLPPVFENGLGLAARLVLVEVDRLNTCGGQRTRGGMVS